MDFYELDLNDQVLDALDDMNFIDCTPIQEHAIPAILEGRDVIGVAQTGTGKTAAYVLPVLSRLCDNPGPENKISCIIMSPTRELAQQIDQSLAGFSYYVPISSVAVYGGNDGIRYEQEKRGLTMGADIIIATPGRLISHLSLSNIDLSGVKYFILDEADRMLDMGFSDDILQIEKMLPRERQTILFSATMPAKIQQLARTILKDPVEIKIAVSKPAEKIKQEVVFCCEVEKLKAVKWLFTHYPTQRVIIFASSKIKVKDIARALLRKGFNVGEMHSDLDQKERDAVMYSFKTQQIDILVATDIVARGIDIDDIQLVVNYDLPHDAEDYVHRIGRTARANNDGNALTLVSEKEYTAFKRMERQLEIEIPAVTLPEDFVKPELKEESFKKKGRRPKKKGKGGQGEGKPKSESRKSDTPKSQKAQKPQEGKTAAENATDNTGNEVKADQAEKKPAKKRRNRHRRKKSDKPTEGGEQKPATPTE
ncbi:MAG: DEAD/DEAH box helicase [Candidatus Paraprevotella stercoravium]|uniref:DEAD/DEAH box helicase n=1 Tax=Candidatus Paraprevotella stercoravium TaxID=2838725 RepID=A0A9E2L759_9BACT|nr:DEAD/DEAH box helicase [Candidatus Paraprevotella stercoravium]